MAAAANSQIRGLFILKKQFIGQIRSLHYHPLTIPSLSHLRGVHDSAYEKNPDEQVQSTVVSDDVNPPKHEQYWGPNPKTGVFGPSSGQDSASGGEGGPHASASEESVLEKKAFFRPLEDLDKPDQA